MVSRLVPRNQSGKQSRLLPRLVPGNQSGKLSRQLPRQLPRHLFQEVSGKLSGQLQDAVSQDPGKPPETMKFGCFPRFLGIGGLGGSQDGRGRLGAQFLIVYILVSSKPALQNPVTLVFGQGVAKTARETANSGQFSATFYGLFRNLTFS